MKILFVNNFRGRGGGEEFLLDLLPGLIAQGVKVGLICRPGTQLADMFKNSAVNLYPIHRSGLSGLSAVIKTAKVIRDNRYDIVAILRGHDIIQSWCGSLLSGRKTVLTYTVQVAEFIRSRFLLSRMRRITTISRYIQDKIISFHPAIASKVVIIHYGIDLNMFSPENVPRGLIRKRFLIPPETTIIGTVGDLWKNQLEFLDALVLVRKRIADVRFALVASETDIGHADIFRRRAVELGLSDTLLWTGRLSKEDVRSFYADIDIAISTHRNEGFGIWVLEALAMGTPVVAVNEGGIRDSLEDCPAGTLVDGGPDAMAAAVLRIAMDKAVKQKMSDAGPRWVSERFNKQRMVDDYYRFFTSLMT